jgi:hypothetical protein
MAKFEVELETRITKTQSYVVNITKAEVIEHFDLEGEDKAEWVDHVEDYLADKVEEMMADDRLTPSTSDPMYDDTSEEDFQINTAERI